jgi:hypothetical protein
VTLQADGHDAVCLRALFVFLLGPVVFAFAACDAMPERVRDPAPRASVSVSPPVTASVLPAARSYVDAARAHAKTCICFSDPFEGLIRDFCDGSGPELEAVKRAGLGIASLDGAGLDLEPRAAAFVHEAALHARWLGDYSEKIERWSKDDGQNHEPLVNPGKPKKPGKLRGGVSAFQTLARRFNEWQPNAKVSAIAYGAYRPGGSTAGNFSLERATLGFWAISRVEYEKKLAALEFLPWIECFDGPCMVGY